MSGPKSIGPVRIRLRTPPAAAGLLWIRRGLRAFLRRPGGFMGLFGLVLLALLMVAMTSPLVEMAAMALMPLLSLGFMVATEDLLNDLAVRPRAFWAPVARDAAARRALLNIGLVYLATFLLMYFFGDRLDGGEAKAWMQAIATPRPDGSMPEPPPISGLGMFVLLLKTFGLALVSIPLWHAPALVHWGGQRAAQAMFSSIVALWRTRAAFGVYLLGWCAIGSLFIFTLFLLAAAFGGLQMAVVLMTPVSWALSAVFYVTLWFGFADTFEITAAGGSGARAG
ncbi:MAG: BPSS1780 family membrane protein [Burkholderiaceae bacterium]